MLDIRQLHYFVAVAEDEHVGRAAERLHISQSPLSRQIAQLEEKLGLVLFERSQQRIRLTRDGRTFLAETRAFLNAVASFTVQSFGVEGLLDLTQEQIAERFAAFRELSHLGDA